MYIKISVRIIYRDPVSHFVYVWWTKKYRERPWSILSHFAVIDVPIDSSAQNYHIIIKNKHNITRFTVKYIHCQQLMICLNLSELEIYLPGALTRQERMTHICINNIPSLYVFANPMWFSIQHNSSGSSYFMINQWQRSDRGGIWQNNSHESTVIGNSNNTRKSTTNWAFSWDILSYSGLEKSISGTAFPNTN